MAGTATAQYLCVIDREHRHKYIRVVTIFAHIAALDMCQVFADCLCAVMAANAVPTDIDMIEVCWEPADGRVAVIAIDAARDVRRVFTGRGDTVMT